MEQTGKSSRKLWFVVIGLVVVALLVIGAVVMLIGNGAKKQDATTSAKATASQVDIKTKVAQDLQVTKDSQTQATKDLAAAQAAADASKNQVKVMQ